MKKFNRKTAKPINVSSWLTVDNPSVITKRCANIIQKALDIDNLVFTPSYNKNNKISYSLKGSSCYSITDEERNVFVIPVKSLPYWLTIHIVFMQELTRYKLSEITVKIFKGMMIDVIKEPYFRAEWHIPGENEKTDHAQPHWHVYKTTSDIEHKESVNFIISSSEKTKEFGVDTQNDEPIKKEIYHFDKFHFAMASKWHLDDEHQIKLENDNFLYKWLERCIEYIMKQLLYISQKEGIV